MRPSAPFGRRAPPVATDRRPRRYVASQNGSLGVVALLVERGADINQRSTRGFTPLYIASSRGHADVARLLVDRGAELEDDWNPLCAAAEKGHVAVARLLLERGMDPNAKQKGGQTAVEAARRHPAVLALFEAPPPSA